MICRHCHKHIDPTRDEFVTQHGRDGTEFSCGCFEIHSPIATLLERMAEMNLVIEAAQDFVEQCDMLRTWPVEIDILNEAVARFLKTKE